MGTANTAELIRTGVLNDAATPLVGPYTGADSLRSPVNPYIFHIRASYADEIERMVDQFARTGFRHLAIFCEDDAFGQAGLTAFEVALKKRDLDASMRVVVGRGASDLSGAIKVLRDKPPEGVVMATAGAVSANFIKVLRDAGLQMPVMGYSVNDYAAIVKVAGPASARGTGFTQVMPDPAHCNRPICREFTRLYRKYGPAGVSASPNTMEGFIAARVLTEGLHRSGSNPSGSSLMKALETINDLDLGGFTVSFGPGNRSGSKYIDIGVLSARGTMRY